MRDNSLNNIVLMNDCESNIRKQIHKNLLNNEQNWQRCRVVKVPGS